MKHQHLLQAVAIGTVLALGSTSAFAKVGSPQTHHCKLADGSMDLQKTKKQCAAAKGSWAKDATTGAAASATPATPPKS